MAARSTSPNSNAPANQTAAWSSGSNAYMLIRLKQTWYHYCQIDQGPLSKLLAADSKGRIKDSGTGGKSSCRDKPVPEL